MARIKDSLLLSNGDRSVDVADTDRHYVYAKGFREKITNFLVQLHQDEEFADVQFKTQDGSYIKAHRNLLAKICPSLRDKLRENKVMNFTRWSPGAVKEVFNYLFQRRAELNFTNVLEVISLARKLNLHELEIEALAWINYCVQQHTVVFNLISQRILDKDRLQCSMKFAHELAASAERIRENRKIFDHSLGVILTKKGRIFSTRNNAESIDVNLPWPVGCVLPSACTGGEGLIMLDSTVDTPSDWKMEKPDRFLSRIFHDVLYIFTRSKNDLSMYHLDLSYHRSEWSKHPRFVPDLFGTFCVHKGILHGSSNGFISRLNTKLHEMEQEWEKIDYPVVGQLVSHGHVLNNTVVFTRLNGDLLTLFSSTLYNAPEPMKEIKIDGGMGSPQAITSLVIENKLHLLSTMTLTDRFTHLIIFDPSLGEVQQFQSQDSQLMPELSSIDIDHVHSDTKRCLFASRKHEEKNSSSYWSFCLKTRTWRQYDRCQVNQTELASFDDWQKETLIVPMNIFEHETKIITI